MKAKRMFTASYITAPVINAGYRSPKRPVTLIKSSRMTSGRQRPRKKG